MSKRLKQVARRLCLAGLIGVGAASLVGLLGRLYWLFDLSSHFRVQYLWILFGLSLAFAAQKMWKSTAGATALLILNAISVLPLYFGPGVPRVSQDDSLEVLVFNVNFENLQHDEISAYVMEQDADVVIILEATAPLTTKLSKALPTYQVIAEDRVDAFGMLLYSKPPMSSKKVVYLGDTALPSIAVELSKSGITYSILAVHTMPPVSSDHSAMRDRMLSDAATWARDKPNALVLGDLNVTPWSHAFGTLLDAGKLLNSQRGFGIQTTWPNGNWLFSIPIDHALHSPSLVTLGRVVGPFLGSDHRPLRVRVGAALD
jgi:endonuclease/exonuclease/phosphatase (EEP) superfamily protein YafD